VRIAVTVDPYIPVPPVHYGGIERVVDFLARGLVDRGHEVALFAHPESRTSARLVPYGVAPHTSRTERAMELWQVGSKLWKLRNEIDIVHSFGRLAALLPILPMRSLPKIQSYQREIPCAGVRRAHRLAGESLGFTACSTSMYSGKSLPGVWTTIPNGVDMNAYTFVPEVPPDAPLVFLGRIERIKGAHHAIEIARASGRRLVIAGNVIRSGPDASYFDDEIAPAIDGDRVRYLGPVDDVQKNELLGKASALLMPIEWEEPFGIVMIEAMACGTPTVGFARGSVPEIVLTGVNGFVCRGVNDAVDAVARLRSLSRFTTRKDVERRFSSDVIVDSFEVLYRNFLPQHSRAAPTARSLGERSSKRQS
jgi:glycosyltransferase involved in cell wall biosynthesis